MTEYYIVRGNGINRKALHTDPECAYVAKSERGTREATNNEVEWYDVCKECQEGNYRASTTGETLADKLEKIGKANE